MMAAEIDRLEVALIGTVTLARSGGATSGDAVFRLGALVAGLAGFAVVWLTATGVAAAPSGTATVVFAGDAAVLLTKARRTVAVLAAPPGHGFAATSVTGFARSTVISRRTTGLTFAVYAELAALGMAWAVRVSLAVWVVCFTAGLPQEGTQQRRYE